MQPVPRLGHPDAEVAEAMSYVAERQRGKTPLVLSSDTLHSYIVVLNRFSNSKRYLMESKKSCFMQLLRYSSLLNLRGTKSKLVLPVMTIMGQNKGSINTL